MLLVYLDTLLPQVSYRSVAQGLSGNDLKVLHLTFDRITINLWQKKSPNLCGGKFD